MIEKIEKEWKRAITLDIEPLMAWTKKEIRIIHFSQEFVPKLLAIAKAASNEALLWNEDRCNQEESDKVYEARDALIKALKGL